MDWPINFVECGFRVEARSVVPQPVGVLARDPLRLLEPYRWMGFRFCTYWDEAVNLSSDQVNGCAFGACDLGIFILGDDEAVHLYTIEPAVFEDRIVRVNEDFASFVSCYSLFVAAVFILKSHLDSTVEGSNDAVKWLGPRLEQAEKGALAEGGFWDQLLYMLDDGMIPVRPPVLSYIQDGRAQGRKG